MTTKPLAMSFLNGVNEEWTYEPLTDRLRTSATTPPGSASALAYTLSYDANDNPVLVTRYFGPGGSTASDTLVKRYAYDDLDRLTWASYSGIDVGTRPASMTLGIGRSGGGCSSSPSTSSSCCCTSCSSSFRPRRDFDQTTRPTCRHRHS